MAAPRTPAQLPRRELGHLPALDGLRAVAVLAVLAYHGGLPASRGGALGVDVFFVLSGFLITRLLLAEVARSDRVGLGDFYARRARRLAPALLVLLLGVAAYAALTHPAGRSPTIRRDALAALFYVANWAQVWWHQSYFAAQGTPSPVRHLWSLAVEEQWYLVWPLLLLALLRVTRRRLPVLLGAVGVLALASAAWMAHLTPRLTDPSRAYYGTDSHAQPLLVGAGLAILLWWRPVASQTVSRALAVAGPVALLACVVVMTRVEATAPRLYHGGFLVFALATALVIASAASLPGSPLGRALALRPLRWVGRISYSLYLWHWLIDVWLNPTVVHWSRWPLFGARTALAFAAATLSYAFVEQPVRTARWASLRRPRLTVLASTGAAALLVAGACWTIGPTTAVPAVSATDALVVPPGGYRILVVGDSVGWSLARGPAPAPKVRIANAALLGCGVLPRKLIVGDTPVRDETTDNCDLTHRKWDHALSFPTSLVVVTWGTWEVFDHVYQGRVYRVPDADYRALLVAHMRAELAYLRARTTAPIVVLDLPCAHQPHYLLGAGPNPRDDPARVAWYDATLAEALRRAPAGTSEVRWSEWLCPGGKPLISVDGHELRPDGAHFERSTMHYAWDWLLPRLLPLAKPVG